MACTMDVSDRTVRKNSAEIHLVIHCSGYDISKHPLSVLRMNALGPFLKRRSTLFWLETKQAVGFRGREDDLFSGGVVSPNTPTGQAFPALPASTPPTALCPLLPHRPPPLPPALAAASVL